ncbi:MAG: cytochrome c biogenesis protein CcdA [Flavipsychrobacter sp.]|nr:cytochrome c biogenesis protein CcdA [Flavipsychrobacter sp.]
MKVYKVALLVFLSVFISSVANHALGQMVQDPTTWTFEAKKKSANTYDLVFHLKLKKDWHIWSFNAGGDGLQVSPSFELDKDPKVKAVGKPKEKGKLITEKIDGVDGDVHLYKDKVDYIQTVTVKGATVVKGTYGYQVCNESMCLPPKTKPFSITISVGGADTATIAAIAPESHDNDTASAVPADASMTAAVDTTVKIPVPASVKKAEIKEEKKSMLMVFLEALLGGILAVLTPCVYSMIPITVSFFTKRSKTRAEGLKNAGYYSLSIIIIFTLLGVAISAIFGGNALNTLSTNWIANLVFFVLFVVFGISFLGAFEITLPSSWTNKTDSKANTKSFSGIFFMALTLVIVSFSCTGPIIGPLLVIAAKGGFIGPAIGMFGFSFGLALPFALFAVFPGMLNKIASSGGWLNQVKVVLGFIELALALKFFSNADQSMGWRLLDREIFIALWIVIFVLLGFYLLGKLKLSHDDENKKNVYGQEYVSIFKLFLAIGSFTFAVYLFPGMWGAPLNGMSQFLPPIGTQEFVLASGGEPAGEKEYSGPKPEKYVDIMKQYEPSAVRNLGLITFFDYNEALAAAKKLKKPVFLDFTGINCVNCRKMETQVWSNPEVLKRMKNDFVVASLFCDFNRIDLPKNEQYFSKDLNSQVVTIGNKNADIQAAKFGSNSQPYYFFVDEEGNKLADAGYSYDPDIQKFIDHLERVKANYKKLHP